MITKIAGCENSSTQNRVYNNICFQGLTNRMGKKVYNGFYSMESLFPKDCTKNSISGRLPDFMQSKIKTVTSDIEGATKEIFDTFAQTSDELREFEPTASSTINELKYRRKDSTVKNLEDVLIKYHILKPWDDFNLEYIDKGGKGSVWKLAGLRNVKGMVDDEFVIKVFHTKSVQTNAFHGCYPEINAATYWMNTLGSETNRGKFFWGDVNAAYMINKFIDEDVRLPKKYPNPEDYGMKFTDEDAVHIHNVCKNYSYDWGGGVVINQVINSNKFAREVMHDIQKQKEKFRIPQWQKRFHWKPNGNYDSKFAGLALSIKFIDPSYRVSFFKQCLNHRGKYTDRALGYTLKYLPHENAIKYYEELAKSTKDHVLKEILHNEIPLLATKDEYRPFMHDDLIRLSNISEEYKNRIDQTRLKEYLEIAKKYQLDKDIINL